MKITIDAGKIFKVLWRTIITMLLIYSLVFTFLTGIKILNAKPWCLDGVCISGALDDPLFGWVCLLVPLMVIAVILYRIIRN
uniref:Uncharacterized protein n=1 Tax=Leclercia adecarboxylata TaxID=83655 RepID=A0A482LZV5_9ENTR|nr:Hypothetical protein [Leclercia adecarboxylata]